MRFASKIDRWVIAVLGLPLVSSVIGAATSGVPLIWLVPALLTAAILPLLLWTDYEVTASDLRIRCGFFRTTVPLDALLAVRPSRSPLSSPALSLDRLDVQHRGGHVLISPRDREGFIAELRQRVPGVPIDGLPGGTVGNAGGSSNTLVVVLVLASLAVALTVVVGVTVGGSRPPIVEIGPGRVTVRNALATASFAPAEVVSVSLEERWPNVGRRLYGFAGGGSLRGRFRVDGLGDGYVFAERDRPFVLIRTGDSFVLIGFHDATRTRRIYDDLRKLTAR